MGFVLAATDDALWQDLQPHLVFWLALAWTVYLLGLAGWIVLQKREPVATLSWIMSLALLPVVGLVIYHLLGPQRIRRQRLRRLLARSRASLRRVVVTGWVCKYEGRLSPPELPRVIRSSWPGVKAAASKKSLPPLRRSPNTSNETASAMKRPWSFSRLDAARRTSCDA